MPTATCSCGTTMGRGDGLPSAWRLAKASTSEAKSVPALARNTSTPRSWRSSSHAWATVSTCKVFWAMSMHTTRGCRGQSRERAGWARGRRERHAPPRDRRRPRRARGLRVRRHRPRRASSHRRALSQHGRPALLLAQAGYCQLEYPCSRTTQVWALTQEYVAIRDLKMCGCPSGFVHGLALPRFTVTGVEDPRRPDGIWRFAWNVARERIPEEDEIALAVNPPAYRTQDQLHVHLVRLLADARGRVDALRPVRVERLEDVWAAATEHAASQGIASYGVIVLSTPDGGWLVGTVGDSPERDFTRARCSS